jgi:chitodextrinase
MDWQPRTTDVEVERRDLMKAMGVVGSLPILGTTSATAVSQTTSNAEYEVRDSHGVENVWSGHPVGFDIETDGPWQYAAFYDTNRQMTIGQRRLGEADWTLTRLPESVGWDSHNFIQLETDARGYVHVSGNMHNDPLVYFRSGDPHDVTTLERVDGMIGSKEDVVTYPLFFEGPDGGLFFTHRSRDGGTPSQMYNSYDVESQSWNRALSEPLTEWDGYSVYYMGANGLGQPLLGPDGYFHMVWVWREHGGANSNRDLSYARTTDLVHWEKSDGTPYELPITIDEAEIVDPVPVQGGMINGRQAIGFDTQDRTVVSNQRYDGDGNSQIYNIRLEDGEWVTYQTSDWDTRWDFGGGGSIEFEISLSSIWVDDEGRILQEFSNETNGESGTWVLDEETLQPLETIQRPPKYPSRLQEPNNNLDPNDIPDNPGLDGSAWIWYPEFEDDTTEVPAEHRYFRRSFAIPADRTVERAVLVVTADNVEESYVNGTQVGSSDDFPTARVVDVTSEVGGETTVAIDALKEGGWAGLVATLGVTFENGDTVTINTNDQWKAAKDPAGGWTTAEFDDSGWVNAKEYADYPASPWGEIGGIEPIETIVNWDADPGCDPAFEYALRWETLPPNRDQARGFIPDSTTLSHYTFIDSDTVRVDLEPRPDINGASADLIPVRIYSDDSLDHGSLRFGASDAVEACGGARPKHDSHAGNGNKQFHLAHFPVPGTGLEAEDEKAVLRGQTHSGDPVYGETAVDVYEDWLAKLRPQKTRALEEREIAFEVADASGADRQIETLEWDFGDGTTAAGWSNSHSYDTHGDYTVALTATDTSGYTTIHEVTVTVDMPPKYLARLRPEETEAVTGEEIAFDAEDSSGEYLTIESLEWDFGDGTTATGWSASHSYDSAGDYTVSLTATATDGYTTTHQVTVTIERAPLVSQAGQTDVPRGGEDGLDGDTENTYGQTFTVEQGFSEIWPYLANFHNPDSKATLTLYEGSPEEGLTELASVRRSWEDNSFVELDVGADAGGTYYLEMSDPEVTPSWWWHEGVDGLRDVGGTAYVNRAPVDQTNFCFRVYE